MKKSDVIQFCKQHINEIRGFLLIFIFMFPVIVGWLLYHYHEHFSFKTTNYGILVNPPLNVPYLLPPEKKWRILYVSRDVCDVMCEKTDYQLHQVQKALGKNRERVSVARLKSSDVSLKKLKTEFIQRGENNFILTNSIFIIDPYDNLFMYYSGDTDPMNILKDIKHVLEVSQIG